MDSVYIRRVKSLLRGCFDPVLQAIASNGILTKQSKR